ncbi:MAG: flagellar filament capping protein FliD [Rhodothermales bacterium]
MVGALASSLRANDPYEQLISQIIRLESQPKFDIEAKKVSQQRMKSVLDGFDSTLSTLNTRLSSFTDQFNNPFQGRGITLPENSAFTASATDDASYGSHSVQVERLASTDTRLSQQFTDNGTSLRSFFDSNGSQTFDIGVFSPTDDDEDRRVNVSVTVDPTGSTDEEILQEISDAINTAMKDAYENEDIGDDNRASASLVNETTDTARLTLRSGDTGFENRLTFSDSANGLLSLLDVNNNDVANGTGGGQVTAIGTSETDSELNSVFKLDGLTMYRSSNQVSDALTGVTLNLREAGGDPVDFTVEPDSDGIVGEIEGFIEEYNSILDSIKSRTNVDGATQVRGLLAGDSTFTSLRFNMRNDIVRSVSGQTSDQPQALTDLGIEITEDGTLKLADKDELISAVEDNAEAVRSLFASDDGVAKRLEARLDVFLGTNGILDTRKDNIDENVRRLDNRIESYDFRLQQRTEQLRAQFAQLQEISAQVGGQSQYLSSILPF